MTAERQTPVDENTGLPLPIYPASDDLGVRSKKLGCNWHHLFNPRNDEILASTDGGAFLRDSRLQLTPKWLHERYHQIYTGPPIPEVGRDQLLLGVLAVAGYLPELAIDVTRSEDRDSKVVLDEALYRQMTGPRSQRHDIGKQINAQRFARIGRFMMAEVLNQNIEEIDQSILDQFLETKDQELRLRLGRTIIDALIEQVTEPIEPIYAKAYRQNKLATTHIRRPSGIIKVVTASRHHDYIEDLRQKIITPDLFLTYSGE